MIMCNDFESNDKNTNIFSGVNAFLENIIGAIIGAARRKVVYYDPCFHQDHLQLFTDKLPWVRVQLVTTHNSSISQKDIDTFNEECGFLEVIYENRPMDRVLVIDDTYCYQIGVCKDENIALLSPIRTEELIAIYANLGKG